MKLKIVRPALPLVYPGGIDDMDKHLEAGGAAASQHLW